MMGFDLEKLDTATYVDREDSVTEPVTALEIDALGTDIRVLPAKDGACRVVSRLNEKIGYSLSVTDGKLCIECEDDRSWYEKIGFGLGKEHITVYLPTASLQELTVKVKSGDVAVSDLQSGALEIKSSSGDIKLTDMKVETKANVSLSSGDITLRGVEAGSLSVKTTSGDITLKDTEAKGQINLTVTSGDIDMEDVLTDTLCAETTSGDIEFERIDGRTLTLETTSGDVEGSLLSGKNFDADATSGDVNVPSSDPAAGICKVKTTSGDIQIRIVK